MKYTSVTAARFISRPNRFIATVEVGGQVLTVHVKNTGRCRELLVPDARVYLASGNNPTRRTPYDLIAVEKQTPSGGVLLINMDSQCPNAVAAEWLPKSGLFSPRAVIRREVTSGDSRFDIYVEDGDRRAFIEVKGVTLERDGVAMFPDAPTARGVKHLSGLAELVGRGYECYALFVIQMRGVTRFMPNRDTDPDFAKALRRASDSGVKILAVDCTVTPDSITAENEVKIELGEGNE